MRRPSALPRFLLPSILLLSAFLAFSAGDARADCDPRGPAEDGSMLVVCSGPTPDGFDADDEDNITVRVRDAATVGNQSNNPAVSGIVLNDDSKVNIQEEGRVIAAGDDNAGIEAGRRLEVDNDGAIDVGRSADAGTAGIRAKGTSGSGIRNDGGINVQGAFSRGVDLSEATSGVKVDNRGDGTISVDGLNAIGVLAEDKLNFTNRGSVIVDGELAAGAVAFDDATIDNRGTITARGLGAHGIAVGGTNASVTNRDTIDASGDGAVGIAVLGRAKDISNQDTINVSGDSFTDPGTGDLLRPAGISALAGSPVENSGTIRVDGSDAMGVLLEDGGALTNSGRIDTTGGNDNAVFLQGSGSKVTNRGRLVSDGIAVSADPDARGIRVVNESGGRIETRDSGNAALAILGSGDGSDTVDNSGQIVGAVDLDFGDDEFVWRTGSSVSASGAVVRGGSGSDTLKLAGSGSDRFRPDRISGIETLRVQSGTWTIDGTGFSDDVGLDGGFVVFPDGFVVGGELVQRSGSTLGIGLRDDGAGNVVADKITVRDDAVINGNVEFTSQAPLDDQLDAVFLETTFGTISGDPSSTATDSAVLDIDFELRNQDRELAIRVTGRTPYADVAVTRNQKSVATNLDEVRESGNMGADFASVLGAIDFFDEAGIQNAYDQLGPEYYDAHTSTAMAYGRRFGSLLLDPPLTCEADGPREPWQELGDCRQADRAPWVMGFGDFLDRDTGRDHISWDESGGGLSLGINQKFWDYFNAAFGFGAARSHLDVKRRGNGAVTLVDLGLHLSGSYRGFSVRSAANFGVNWHDSRRKLELRNASRHANGDWMSRRATVMGLVGYKASFRQYHFEPFAAVDFTWLSEDKVIERKAGDVSLDVRPRYNTLTAVGGGLRTWATFELKGIERSHFGAGGAVLVPELRFAYRKVVDGENRSVKARFQGAPAGVGDFRVRATDADQAIEWGGGVSYQPFGGATVGVHYDGAWGDDTFANRIRAVVRLPLQDWPGGEG